MAVAEAYPDLKANQNFLALQQELTSTEDRIASSRRYYNALVRDLNTKVESVPSNILANIAGIKRAEYFETPGHRGASSPTSPSATRRRGPLATRRRRPLSAPLDPARRRGRTDDAAGPGQSASGLPQAQAPDPTVDRHTPNE